MGEWLKYEAQLRDPRWIARRDEILNRDGYRCQKCPNTNFLQVHHRYYTSGKMAWEYPDPALITLCRRCHAIEHGLITEQPVRHEVRRIGEIRQVKHIATVMAEFIQSMMTPYGQGSAV